MKQANEDESDAGPFGAIGQSGMQRGIPGEKLSSGGQPHGLPKSKPWCEPGLLRQHEAWASFAYDPDLFAPMTNEEMAEEGWI
jgi:hypothetical protein